MSQMNQSRYLRLIESCLAWARMSRVSVKTSTCCGVINCGTELVGAFMGSPSGLVGPASVPQGQFHRAEPQRAQQLGNGRQQLGRRQRLGLLAHDRPEGTLFAIGFRDIKTDG